MTLQRSDLNVEHKKGCSSFILMYNLSLSTLDGCIYKSTPPHSNSEPLCGGDLQLLFVERLF